ncbi:hypothetical protein AN618_04680 [Fervidicola ferrireducens]|uniref:Uncharacterized protein n=1 Tax=Fervidicola ferrireducens TaxID=520764 RepID=A0A140LCX6_9FIRM|nr:hypothetical protein AN618_04680 [Fervidicola ferrireducens]
MSLELVEARGIEPLSEGASIKASTGLSLVLISPASLPRAGLKTGQLCLFSLPLPKLTAEEEPGAMTPFSGDRARREGRAAF